MEQSIIKDLFKRTLIDFLDSLISILPSEPDLIVARIFIADKVSADALVNSFILKILPFESAIMAHDEKAFLDGKLSALVGNNEDKANHFKMLWRSGTITDSNKQVIWKWAESFIKIIKKYQGVC